MAYPGINQTIKLINVLRPSVRDPVPCTRTVLTVGERFYSLGLLVSVTAVLSKSAVTSVSRGFLFSTMMAA